MRPTPIPKNKEQFHFSEPSNKHQEDSNKAMLNVMEDLEAARAQLEFEKAKDEAMLASIGEGLIAVDNNRKILLVNKATEDMLGWKTKDLLGKEITKLPLVNEEGNTLPLERRPTFKALLENKSVNGNYFFIRKDKTKFPIAIVVTPIIVNRKTVGAIDTFRDITREKEIDQAKSEFVSLASHQLRTPLGIIKWYLEALQSEVYFKKAPAQIQNYLNEINKSNERVLKLVGDLLSVSRIEQGQVKNVLESVDPVAVVTEVVEQMQIVARKKQISLNLIVQDRKIPPINIDVLRLHEVIENLIVNAIEYTMASGIVQVSLNRVSDKLLISVKDTGIGIPATDQKKLFSKFFKSAKAIGHNPEGSGLGLYVVKSYIEGWGGQISVQSQEGKGSIFTITLPLKPNNVLKRGSL